MIVPTVTAANSKVYKVPVYKEVEKGLYAFLKRSIHEAEEAAQMQLFWRSIHLEDL